MAVEWPDFSQANITDASYYEALKAALAERYVAASAGNGYSIAFPLVDTWAQPVPDLERLTNLRDAIKAVAGKFVRLEDERYAWTSWSSFPIAYKGSDVMSGDHSLAVLPPPATPESSADHLRIYRTFLENCAWWIRRFRYVSVAGQSYYTRKTTASGYHSVRDSENWGHEETGEPVEEILAHPEHRELEGSRVAQARYWMAKCSHTVQWADEDVHYSDGWHYDTWNLDWEDIDEELYSGLVVRNGSGLPGRLILVPGYYASHNGGWPIRSFENHLIETLIPTSHPDDGDRMAGKCRYLDQDFEKRAGEWRETYSKDMHGEQSFRVIDETHHAIDRTGHTVYRTTKWSDDGLRSLSTVEEGGWDSWYNYTIEELCDVYVWDFDGFGSWTLGSYVEAGEVGAHGRVVAIPKSDTLPKNDFWDLESLDLNPVRKHPREQWHTIHFISYLRITPVLDFNPSYLYQDTQG